MEFVRNLKSKITSTGHQQESTRDRERRDDFFSFRETFCQGFPAPCTSFAYCPELDVFALGSKSGQIKIFGAPSVEFDNFSWNAKSSVNWLIFLPNKRQIISIEDNQLFSLWQIENYDENQDKEARLSLLTQHSNSGRIKRVSCYCVRDGNDESTNADQNSSFTTSSYNILLGTESGNIYRLDDQRLIIDDFIIFQDHVAPLLQENHNKTLPGSVESISRRQIYSDEQLLISYGRGLVIVWGCVKNEGGHTSPPIMLMSLNESFDVEGALWCRDGKDERDLRFATYHCDGSYAFHSTTLMSITHSNDSQRQQQVDRQEFKPYGPYPLKPITNLKIALSTGNDELVVFAGGMPRSSFSDRHVVTVERNPSRSSSSDHHNNDDNDVNCNRSDIGRHPEHPSSSYACVCFDFSSRVIDFALIPQYTENTKHRSSSNAGGSTTEALLVACEEELICIDLSSPGWPCHRLPYCHSLHCSPVSAAFYVHAIDQRLYSLLNNQHDDYVVADSAAVVNCSTLTDDDVERHNRRHISSLRPWPINGGSTLDVEDQSTTISTDLIITGHEDGSVKLWISQGVRMHLTLTLKTAIYFEEHGLDFHMEPDEENGWPPFRKVGLFDPFSDDTRLSIRHLCTDDDDHHDSGQLGHGTMLACGGAAGQVLLFDMERLHTSSTVDAINVVNVDVCRSATSSSSWSNVERMQHGIKGHQNQRLTLMIDRISCQKTLRCVVQLQPANAITSLCCSRHLGGLLAIGCCLGFALIDVQRGHVLLTKLLLSCDDIQASLAVHNDSTSTLSRFKSLKKSLRESMRRKKRHLITTLQTKTSTLVNESHQNRSRLANVMPPKGVVERCVEARSDAASSLASLVTRLYLRLTPQHDYNCTSSSPSWHEGSYRWSLWVCTNGGELLIYSLTTTMSTDDDVVGLCRSSDGNRHDVDVVCRLVKHVKLKHGAPILQAFLVDSRGVEWRASSSRSVNTAAITVTSATTSEDSSVHHHLRLLVVSEEQLKAFQWPRLSPMRVKNKITALEGFRLRKAIVCTLMGKTDEVGCFLVTLNNVGDVECYSCQTLRRCARWTGCLDATVTCHPPSTLFCPQRGLILFLRHPAQWQRMHFARQPMPIKPRCQLAAPS